VADETETVVLDLIGHCGPVGAVRLPVGKHGSMKPGGRKDMEPEG
jgi:hypothetical protein